MQDFRYALDIPRRGMNRGETAGRTKGDETCVRATIETRNAVRGREEGGRQKGGKPITSRPPSPSLFLTSPFEELIAASIRDCRRYRSTLRFVNEKYRTHGARCQCPRTTRFCFCFLFFTQNTELANGAIHEL